MNDGSYKHIARLSVPHVLEDDSRLARVSVHRGEEPVEQKFIICVGTWPVLLPFGERFMFYVSGVVCLIAMSEVAAAACYCHVPKKSVSRFNSDCRT